MNARVSFVLKTAKDKYHAHYTLMFVTAVVAAGAAVTDGRILFAYFALFRCQWALSPIGCKCTNANAVFAFDIFVFGYFVRLDTIRCTIY